MLLSNFLAGSFDIAWAIFSILYVAKNWTFWKQSHVLWRAGLSLYLTIFLAAAIVDWSIVIEGFFKAMH